jgi:ABC-type transport system substrate-binding protein
MMKRLAPLALLIVALAAPVVPAGAAPEGQMTWAIPTPLVPTWFDPAEMIQQTPFLVLSATHDALVKPMPGKAMAPSLAESWTVSPDGLVYEFVLVGARVEEAGLGLLGGYGFSEPYEDVKLKAR